MVLASYIASRLALRMSLGIQGLVYILLSLSIVVVLVLQSTIEAIANN